MSTTNESSQALILRSRQLREQRGRRHIARPTAGALRRPHIGRSGGCRVFLLLDCSGSMEGKSFAEARRGAKAAARDAIKKGYDVGLIAFNTDVSLAADLGRSPSVLEQVIDRLRCRGSTNMSGALLMARDALPAGTLGARAVILVTDGLANDADAARRAAERAKQAGIDIISIGVEDADLDFLRQVASRTDLASYVATAQLGAGMQKAVRQLPAPPKKRST